MNPRWFSNSIPSSDPMAFVPVVRGENRLEVRNESEAAELILIGAVGKSWWDDSGITEQEVRDALKSIPAGKKINARINSEGGSVKEGLGIYNAFKERRADITAHISGYALSIASVFPLGAGKVISPKSAIWMMHKAWSLNQGNADEMRKAAEMLDAHDETLADIYAAETGKSKEEILSAMEKETWIKGSAAVEYGLADETDDEDDTQASYRPLPKDYLKRCRAPQDILNAISAPRSNPQGAAQPQPPPTAAPTQDHTMNKKLIVALLKKHGIEALETETEEQLQSKLDTIPIEQKPAEQPESKTAAEEIKALRQELKRDRITARVRQSVEAMKITNEEVEIYVNAAMDDEKKTFDILEKKEPNWPGGMPLSGNRCLIYEGNNLSPSSSDFVMAGAEEVINIRKQHKTRGAQASALLEDWENIIRAAQMRDLRRGVKPHEVFGANTISGFTTAFLLTGSLTALQNVWAPFKAISLEYSPDEYKPLATATLKNPTSFGTFGTNLTNFTTNSNSTVGAKTATMNQYTQPFQISNSDLNSGLRMNDLVIGNLGSFSNGVIDILFAVITAANFTATPVITAPGVFGFSDSSTLQGQLQKAAMKNLIIDGTLGASLTNTPGFFQETDTLTNMIGGSVAFNKFGWNMLAVNSRWNGAGNNIKGFACHPQAIIGVHGLPITPVGIPGGVFSFVDTVIPLIGITVRTYTWFDVNTRTMYTSYDLILGVALGDATAGVVIATGAPS